MNILVSVITQQGINRFLLIIFLLLFFAPGKLTAQDTQYWTQTYGTSSTLLGGIVVGSVDDLAATYYNPGNLALANDPNFLFTAKVFEYTSITVDPITTKNINKFGSSSLKPSPSFVVANLTSDWLGKNRIAFSFLTRQSMDLGLKTRFDATGVNTSLSGEFNFKGDLSDIWVGITWSLPIEKKVGIGITQYISTRSYTSRHEINIKTSDSLNRVSAVSGITEYDYLNFRILWKAGIGFTIDPLKFGLTFTTPSINIVGTGSTDINLSGAGLEHDSSSNRDDFLISNFQDDLSSTFNSPFSIGLGVYYDFGNFKLHLATEYFNQVDKYNILTPDPFQTQTGDLTISNDLTAAYDAVLNYGLGMEYYLNPKFTIYAAFNTDFSAYATGEQTNSTISNWNIYHVTAGAAFTIDKLQITSGIATSFANDNVEFPKIRPLTIDNGEAAVERQLAEVSQFKIKVILGVTF